MSLDDIGFKLSESHTSHGIYDNLIKDVKSSVRKRSAK